MYHLNLVPLLSACFIAFFLPRLVKSHGILGVDKTVHLVHVTSVSNNSNGYWMAGRISFTVTVLNFLSNAKWAFCNFYLLKTLIFPLPVILSDESSWMLFSQFLSILFEISTKTSNLFRIEKHKLLSPLRLLSLSSHHLLSHYSQGRILNIRKT